jgi:arsenate reductase (thioredoxin)
MQANVLFLCTGNSARSQMAEAFLRKYAGERFYVYSAGLNPAGINPLTIKVMNEVGIDMSGHTSQSVKEYMGKMPFRYVVTVCDAADAQCPTPLWQLGTKLHWSFEDPAAAQGTEEQKLAKFRQIRDQIEQRIIQWLKELEPTPANSQ